MTVRIRNVSIWDGQDGWIERGDLVLENGSIQAVGEQVSGAASSQDQVIDGEGKVAVPGFINAHTHLYSALARGMALDGFAPKTFTQILEQLWWRMDKALDPASVRSSALVGAMEAVRCGVTTMVDHHASPFAVPGSLDLMKEAVCDEVGLRSVFCYELSDRDGKTSRDQGIEENLRFLSEHGDSMTGAQFGMHASFTVSDKTLDSVAERLPEHAGIHIHVAEGPEDEVACETKHGARIVDRLDRYGFLKPNSILAHCLHINEAEKDLIAARDAIVVHNPHSNMNNAVGCFDLRGFVDRGITVGLGTDGLGCNMLNERFVAGILQNHTHQDALAGDFNALNGLLFAGNQEIVSRLLGVRVGRIEAGAPADVVLMDYTPPTPLHSGTIMGHFLFGIAVHNLRVSDVFVAGRPILREGTFVSIDEAATYAEARGQAQAMWNRIQ